jgi:hypothetical protein
LPKTFFSLIFTLPRVEVIYILWRKNKMKSIALTLAVLFGTVGFALATEATTAEPQDQNKIVVEEVSEDITEEKPAEEAK